MVAPAGPILWPFRPSSWGTLRRLCRSECPFEPRHAHEVEGGAGHVRPELVLRAADVAELPATADGLHPAEDLFDAFAHALAHRIAGMPGDARIDPEIGRASCRERV